MDRLSKIFTSCAQENRSALILFVSAGYPTLAESEKAMELAVENGADILEIGVPFSDPMADGPVIAKASQEALKQGTTLTEILNLVETFRRNHPDIGLILFSYMNVLFHYGEEKLCLKLHEIGMDGILAVDLPLEERSELERPCKKYGLHLIPLLSPATSLERAKKILTGADGFVYCISVRGITGERKDIPPEVTERLDGYRAITNLPLAVGFGLSDSECIHALAAHADGIIIGSAFVSRYGKSRTEAEFFLKQISQARYHSKS